MENLYDLSYWAKIDSEPESVEKQILTLLQENKCQIELNFSPKRKNLAYPIGKELAGYFGTIYFRAEKEVLPKIEKNLLSLENVLRFLIVKRKTLPQSFKKIAETPEPINLPSETSNELK